MIGQMSSMSLQPGTPGTPGPPHPSQQMGMWNTPEHNSTTGQSISAKFCPKTSSDSQMNQWYHQPTPQYQSHYQNLQWTNNQPLHQSQQGIY